MKRKCKNERRNRKIQNNLFITMVISISILFGLLTIQNEATNETNQTNTNNKTTQTTSNNITNGTTNSKNTSNATASNSATKNTTATNATRTTNTSNPTNSTTSTKSSNANLSTLGIRPHDFSGFKAGTTSYKAVVPESTKSIEVYAKPQDGKAKVTGTGKKTLESGNNKVAVVVTAEDGTEKIYTIDIVRGEQEGEYQENSGDGLSELKINNLNLSPEFNTNVYEYTAKYIGEDTKLEIEAIPTDEDYLVEVTGNENLQEGENTITILVSEKNGNNIATYQVILDKSLVDEEAIAREEAEKKAKQQKTMIGIVIAVVILVAIIVFVIFKHRKNQNLAEDYSGVSLYGKSNYDEEGEKEQELSKSFTKEKVGDGSERQEEKVEEMPDGQEVKEKTDGQEQKDNNEKFDQKEEKNSNSELAEDENEEEIENLPKEKLKEKFLDHYSNYEEDYNAESKGKKKKEKHKGKRFKE